MQQDPFLYLELIEVKVHHRQQYIVQVVTVFRIFNRSDAFFETLSGRVPSPSIFVTLKGIKECLTYGDVFDFYLTSSDIAMAFKI